MNPLSRSYPAAAPPIRIAMAGAFVAVAGVMAAVGLPGPEHSGAAKGAVRQAAPPEAPAIAAWLRIASDLEERVPARLLLGGEGECVELDARLREQGLDRAAFRKAAAAVRAEAAACRDCATRDAVAVSLRGVALPEGFEILPLAGEDAPGSEATSEEACRLVRELDARLRNPQPVESS